MLESWIMKKLLAVIILSLLMSSKVFAEQACNEIIDFDWYWTDRLGSEVNRSSAERAKFIIKSTGNKGIKITQLRLSTKNKNIVVKEPRDIYLAPYGKVTSYLYDLNNYNLDVVGSGGYSCRYGSKPIKKSGQTLDEILKQKNKKSGAQKWLDKIRGN